MNEYDLLTARELYALYWRTKRTGGYCPHTYRLELAVEYRRSYTSGYWTRRDAARKLDFVRRRVRARPSDASSVRWHLGLAKLRRVDLPPLP